MCYMYEAGCVPQMATAMCALAMDLTTPSWRGGVHVPLPKIWVFSAICFDQWDVVEESCVRPGFEDQLPSSALGTQILETCEEAKLATQRSERRKRRPQPTFPNELPEDIQ